MNIQCIQFTSKHKQTWIMINRLEQLIHSNEKRNLFYHGIEFVSNVYTHRISFFFLRRNIIYVTFMKRIANELSPFKLQASDCVKQKKETKNMWQRLSCKIHEQHPLYIIYTHSESVTPLRSVTTLPCSE